MIEGQPLELGVWSTAVAGSHFPQPHPRGYWQCLQTNEDTAAGIQWSEEGGCWTSCNAQGDLPTAKNRPARNVNSAEADNQGSGKQEREPVWCHLYLKDTA